jgi:hypothetical protein
MRARGWADPAPAWPGIPPAQATWEALSGFVVAGNDCWTHVCTQQLVR